MGDEKNLKVPKKIPVDIYLLLMNNATKIRIMRDLLSGTKSFKQLSASTKCLSWQLKKYLKQLTEYGLITTTVYPGIPIVIEYTLTYMGELMKPTILAMAEWGSSYRTNIASKH